MFQASSFLFSTSVSWALRWQFMKVKEVSPRVKLRERPPLFPERPPSLPVVF